MGRAGGATSHKSTGKGSFACTCAVDTNMYSSCDMHMPRVACQCQRALQPIRQHQPGKLIRPKDKQKTHSGRGDMHIEAATAVRIPNPVSKFYEN